LKTSDYHKIPFVRNAWPIAAICCLGILGFLIAITIVLALIPIYLPSKSVIAANTTSIIRFDFPTKNIHVFLLGVFYVQYSAPATAATSLTGTVNNAAAVSY
jgi:hypothetical protein